MATNGVNLVGLNLATKTTNAASNATPPSLGYPTTQLPTGPSASIAAAGNVTTGAICTSKVIVNPHAVYLAEVATADGLAVAGGTTAEIIVTGVPASAFDGSYVYFAASAGPNFGSIRRVVSSATGGTLVMDATLVASPTTADKVILIASSGKNPHQLSADATTIGQTTVGGYGATMFRVVRNYVDIGAGIALLTQATQGQKNLGSVQAKKAKFYQEITSLSHAYGN